MARRLLITGITGQDGGFLAEQALARGDRVVGTTRRTVEEARAALPRSIRGDVEVVHASLGTLDEVRALVQRAKPTHLFHLAAPADPNIAWQQPSAATDALTTAVARILEVLATDEPQCRLVYAGSCQVFGPASSAPQSELTPFAPRTPYGAGKAFGTNLVACFRDGRQMHASTAILFNHESGRRQANYATAKICAAAVRAAADHARLAAVTPLQLGALDVIRDWFHARDAARAMLLMGDAAEPADYVIASGVGRTVGDFCDAAYSRVGLDWREHVRSEAALMRAGDIPALVGDTTRIRSALGWAPEVSFGELIDEMLAAQGSGAGSGTES
jgi:GDPmannose 4,6-dehydratase